MEILSNRDGTMSITGLGSGAEQHYKAIEAIMRRMTRKELRDLETRVRLEREKLESICADMGTEEETAGMTQCGTT